MQDPAYELQLKQTLTIKPKGFFIRAIPRAGKPLFFPVPSATTLKTPTATGKAASGGSAAGQTPLYVLYGSNTGNSEAFAQRIATDAAAHGNSLFSISHALCLSTLQDSVLPWERLTLLLSMCPKMVLCSS